MTIRTLSPDLPADLVFSALPSSVAREIEPAFARAGYAVCSNASAYRDAPLVPLLIPEINADHVTLIDRQRSERGWSGLIVTSPNCTTTGVAVALKPLDVAFRLQTCFMASMQAVSGAGYPGVPSLDIMNNVIPYIAGEEEKFQQELSKMLGRVEDGKLLPADIALSAHANRVPVVEGHTVSLSVGFEKEVTVDAALNVLRKYQAPEIAASLPSALPNPLIVRVDPDRPQPRRDRDAAGGMAVTVGRVRPCPILDLRMTTVTHNTLRGAAGGAVLNAELLVASGYVNRQS
jgi:aspartate-semialdehyde dehydrogenase